MHRWRLTAVFLSTFTLVACGGIQIAPAPLLPKALIDVLPSKVGLVIPADQRSFTHTETRGGMTWTISLGAGQQQLSRRMLESTFREISEFADLENARSAGDLQAIFEPRIEQFSFATAQETGGEYVAVTIRYRINVYAPNGERFDSLTLTGYGTASADGLGSAAPMEEASRSAMRDAAARFLTQFPDTEVAKTLVTGKQIQVSAEDSMRALAASGLRIEAVPIRVSRRVAPNWKPAVPTVNSSAETPAAP
jgi:hypothetical protein